MTLLLFLSHYFLFAQLGIRFVHQKIIFAGLLTCAQIIFTEMALGLGGWLYLPWLVFVNGIITAMVFLYVYIFDKEGIVSFKVEGQSFFKGVKNALSPANAILIALASFVFVWMAAAVYFLPPRSSDDIVYHLPPVYEYIINHKIFLLPVTMNGHFSFPHNSQLLFMWPVIFSHSQQFVDAVQVVVAFWGVVVVYGLARAVDTTAKTALFVAFLFLFTPVVLAQMGSNYIDVIMGVFFLATLYYAVMFYKTTRLIYFYAMALAGGLVWGVRYDSMILLTTLVPFLLKGGCSITKKHWMVSIVVFFIAGGFWYLRNFLIFRNPAYPLDVTRKGIGIFNAACGETYVIGFLKDTARKLLVLWKDEGLLSLHGGYGLVFWGIALPAWFYIFVRSLIKREALSFWLSLPLIIGVAKLMPVPLKCFPFTGRYSLFIVALALVALGQTLTIFYREVFFRGIVKFSCVAFAMLSVIQLSAVRFPGYQIYEPIRDFVKNKYTTEEYYIRASEAPKSLIRAWALLDYLTLDDPRGLSCYIAMRKIATCFPMDKTLVSPLYGSHLQNRVWNLQQDKTLPPDAFLYWGPLDSLHYFGDPITPQEVMANRDYILVMQKKSSVVLLFLRKDFLRDPNKQKRLKEALGGAL